MDKKYTKKDLFKLKKILKFCKSTNRVIRIRGRLKMNKMKNKFPKTLLTKMIKEAKKL